ncbi:arginine N-methyltransferase 3 [Tricholoma matsutake]|nr:arginine N-methyltransferase 3 [Tricholoma matsutake 945]
MSTSIHLLHPLDVYNKAQDTESDPSSSDQDDDDQNWDDWVSDSFAKQSCKSLFDEKTFPSVEDALLYDKSNHAFDLNDICCRLSLDFHGRVRLINYIRRMKPSPSHLTTLQGSESLFTSDEYLLPAMEDDPMLQFQANEWSDSEDADETTKDPARRIQALEMKLAAVKQDFADYRSLISQKLDATIDLGSNDAYGPARDNDTHYFQSYGENDIHAVMIQDKVRTSTYAQFISTNPGLFRDAVVLDVGCGTGILSLFAARSGAKRVIAVDASAIAEKAERIVKANGFGDIITVIKGKIEEIALPDDLTYVDIIVSEWMGYALLYESMLDSVLRARDRFLRPGGVMVPSQCKMMLGLCYSHEIYKERIGFWSDVYGFDLSTMTEKLYDEAIVDVVGPNTILSAPYAIKDLLLSEVTSRQLDFSSTFALESTAERRTKVNAFILYFDTFFTVTGHPIPASADVKVIKEGDPILAEVWPVGGKPAPKRRQSHGSDKDTITSFSTGPQSMSTHWKQTLFLLREPISVAEGSVVNGTFYCRKSDSNSRELDVEIHYAAKQDAEAAASHTVVQMYKVR